MGFFSNKPKKTYNDLEMVSVRGYKVGDQYYGKKIIKIEDSKMNKKNRY